MILIALNNSFKFLVSGLFVFSVGIPNNTFERSSSAILSDPG